jgi:hypothetical protein
MQTITDEILARRGAESPENLCDIPHVFGAYDEGEGLTALYLAPLLPKQIVSALRAVGLAENMVDVTPRWGMTTPARALPFAIAASVPPIELLSGEPPPARPARPIMANPHAALPDPSRKVAVSVHPGCHGVVYSHHPAVLRAFLHVWIGGALGVQERVVSTHRDAPVEMPPALDKLLAHLTPGDWWEPVLQRHQRFWTAEFVHLRSDVGSLLEQRRVRWVGQPEGSWLPDWWW